MVSRDYKDGSRYGSWLKYHKNGQLQERGNFKGGIKDGLWNFFLKDGTKRTAPCSRGFDEGSGTYRDGNKDSN